MSATTDADESPPVGTTTRPRQQSEGDDPTASRGEAMGTRRAVLWWLGWRPLVTTVAGGGFVGVVLGNALVTWWLRWLNGTRGGSAVTDLVSVALLPLAAILLVGIAVGAAAWWRGTAEINRRYEEVLDDLAAEHATDSDDSTLLRADRGLGRVPMVEPRRTCSAHVVAFGTEAGSVRPVRVDLPDRRLSADGQPRSVDYADVEAVRFEEPVVTIDVGDGNPVTFETVDDPEPVLAELRARGEQA